jgi:hypothetical protein
MNGSTENRAPGAFEQSGGREVVLTWAAANRMLPLVRRIVADVMEVHSRLARMQSEKDRLDRERRTLAWPERSRRYQLDEAITADERHLRQALGELDGLGVALFDPETGLVGLPTAVNKRRAYFSWRPGEDGLTHWHYAEDAERRPIPANWTRTEARHKT